MTSEGDCPQLPALLARTRVHHDVREVSADEAYSSVDNHDVLDSFSVEAFIRFKVNAVVNPKAPTWSRHLCEFTLNQERFRALPPPVERRDGLCEDEGALWRVGRLAAADGAGQRSARDVRRPFVAVPMDELLAGQWLSPRVCPQCGHAPHDFVDEDTMVGDGPIPG